MRGINNSRIVSLIFVILSLLDLNNGSLENEFDSKEYFDKIINEVNNGDATWKAEHNFLTETMHESMTKYLVGSMEDVEDIDNTYNASVKCKHHLVGHANHTKEFNGIEVWSYCPSVKHIKNQGKCASDWALAPASVISDRVCIFSKGKVQVSLSAHEPLSCCKTCGWGCRKGYPSMVFKRWITKGLVTGGDYNSKEGCQPYNIQPCNKDAKSCFFGRNVKTPPCKPHCYNPDYKKQYTSDLNKGASMFGMRCPHCAGEELKENGPLTATMIVYEDFLAYRSGVYHHVTGKRIGMLTVKLVGFNDDADPSYWIALNSWGTKWGDKGTFKIRRAVGECMIEGSMRGALVEDDDDDSKNH